MTADLFAPRRRLITPLRVLISFVGLGLVTVLVLAVSVTQCTPPDPARHGRGFYNQEKWQSAIKQFSRALDRHPDDVSSLYYRGLAYLYDGDTGRAIDDLEKVRRLAPDTERIDERLGRAYLAHGNHTRAREIFESIAVREPDNSRVLHLLAQTHYDLYQAHLVEIGALVTRYIGGELAAELLRDLELLVFSRHMEDELHALLLEHERVFDASGERELQRLMDRAKQEIDRSVPHFRAALAVPEFDPDAALSLARIYFRQFRLGWTRDECEDAIRRCSDPLETLDFRLLLASVYFNMGVFDRCADVYRKTLDLIDDLARQDVIPDSEWAEVQSQKDEVIDRLLPVLLILEDYRSVSELAQKRGDPTDLPILFYYLGTSAYHRGEIEGARQYLQKAKIAFENKPELRIRYRDAFLDTYLNLAQLAIEESQFGRAENYLASLLQRDPSSAEGHLALADLRLRQGNERGALQALEKAMFEIPESAELFERWWQLSTESWAAMGLPADAPRGEVWNYYRRNQLANYLRLRTAQAILLELFPRRVEQDTQLALDIVTQLSIRYPDFIPVKRIQARAFLARNDFKLARELFEQILEVHPEDERAIGGLRACAAGLKDIDGLEKWTHEALKVGAAGEGPLAILDRLIETGRYNRALAYAEQLLSLPAYRGLDVEVRRLRALLLEGNTEEVLLQLQSLLEKGTQHPALTPLLVNALVRSGRTARAFEAIRKAEKDGPENTQAFTAELYRELLSVLADQEISRASTLIVKAAQAAYPADEEIAALASRFYRRVQSYSQAIQVLSRAASGSLTTSNLLDLALLSIPTGRRLPTGSTAWRELEKQLESNTATKPVLAILLQMSGDSDQALKNLPDPKDARSLRAARLGWPTATLAVRAQRGDFAEASEVLTTFPPDYGIGYKQILDYCAADGLYKQEVSDALLELALFGQVPQWEREAIGSVEFLLSVFPTNSALRRLHPRLLSLTGASTEEVLALEERLSREDPRPENFRALAAARLRQGDTAGAIRALLDLREHGKPTPVDLRLMAQALAEAGEPMAAVRVFDILFRFDQLKVDELDQLAAASDRPKAAQRRSAMRWAVIDPENLLLYGELFAGGLPEQVSQDPLERLLPPQFPGNRVLAGALEPPDWELDPASLLAILQRQKLDPSQARRVFDLLQTHTTPGTRSIPLARQLGKVDRRSVPIQVFQVDGRIQEAPAETTLLLEAAENAIRGSRLTADLRAHYLAHLARHWISEGRGEPARRLLERALALAPDRTSYYRLLGDASALLGENRGAELEYQIATRLFPWDDEAWAQLAWFYGELGQDLEEAAKLLERRITAQPDSALLLTGLAWIRYQQGRAFDAAQLAESAWFRDPRSSRAAYVLGLSSYALGRLDESLKPLAIAAGPGSQLRGDDLEHAKNLLYRARRRLGATPQEATQTQEQTWTVSASPK